MLTQQPIAQGQPETSETTPVKPATNVPYGRLILILILIPIVALLAALFFDMNNLKIEKIVKDNGGQTTRKSKRSEPSLLPEYTWFTQWQHPIATIDLTDCDINDEDVAEICALAGEDLKQLILDGNPRITNESVRHIDRLRTLDLVSVKGTSINDDQARRLYLYKGYFVGLGNGERKVVYGP